MRDGEHMAVAEREIVVRPLGNDDVEEAIGLLGAAFREADGNLPERYRPPALRDRLQGSLSQEKQTRSRFLVFASEGRLAAIGGYAREAWCPIAWSLYLAAVHPDLQGRGLGHRLIGERLRVIEAATSGHGMVLVSSRRPNSFHKLGFQALRTMPHGPTLMMREFEGTP